MTSVLRQDGSFNWALGKNQGLVLHRHGVSCRGTCWWCLASWLWCQPTKVNRGEISQLLECVQKSTCSQATSWCSLLGQHEQWVQL
jgi:hypothetical protein